MAIFEKTRIEEAQFQEFIKKTNDVYSELLPFAQLIDVNEIKAIRNNFILKTEDFFRKDRKLNIGIVGRVKSGKSSFLNTLLFDGKEVLPKSVTPVTSVLTKIEYADQNMLEIEYLPGAGRKGIEKITYVSYEELMKALVEYIGEEGMYTQFVKSVVIYTDNQNMQGISIVDTPGFCDPVVERTEKTKQFLEVCDVVFFLSKSTGFLDKGDVELLASQLPLKGVKKLVLLCSRMDDGLRDTMWAHDNILKALEDNKRKLRIRAEKTFEDFWNNNYVLKGNTMQQCKNPVFISSMAQDMADKPIYNYSEQEKKVFEDLNCYGDLNIDALKKIGNFEEVKNILEEVVRKKDEILHDKAALFASIGKDELKLKILKMESQIETRIQEINDIDRAELLEKKRYFAIQVEGFKAELGELLSELYNKMEQNKSEISRELMGFCRDCSQTSEREGLERHYQITSISSAKWYRFWNWGESIKEVRSYDEKYTYLDIADVQTNIRIYTDKAKAVMEESIKRAIDIKGLKNQLLNAIINNFDSMDENYSATYFKMIVEKTLAKIEIPHIHLDISKAVNSISQRFSGEIRSIAKRTELKNNLTIITSDLFRGYGDVFKKESDIFCRNMDSLMGQFSAKLLNNLNVELDLLMMQIEEKDKIIKGYENTLKALGRVNSK